MVNAQTWLESQEQYNTKEKRAETKELDISDWDDKKWEEKKEKPVGEKLEGKLDLSDFLNLEKLNCSCHKITSLNLPNCSNLTELKCWDNELTQIDFPTSLPNLKIFYAWTNNLTEIDWSVFSPESLTKVSISNNNLQEQDISIFSKFINLEELCIGNDIEERLEKNCFIGSLEPLKTLTKLKKLQIERTKVEENFEHLPKDLQVVCWNKGEIAKQLNLDKEDKEKLLKTKNKDDFQKVLDEVITSYAKKKLGLNLTSRQREQIGKIVERIGNALAIKELKEEISNFEQVIERDKRQNDMIAKVIPLERLFVVRSNIKQFINKWGKEEKDETQKLEVLNKLEKKKKELEEIDKEKENNQGKNEELTKEIEAIEKKLVKEQNNWRRKIENFLNDWVLRKKQDKNLKIINLQSLDQINKNLWTSRKVIYTTQLLGRSAAMVGAFITLQGYSNEGATILGIYPLAELLVSNMEKSREDRKVKWNEFLTDADNFLDNYNELLGIVDQFRLDDSKTGEVNETINNLSDKVKEFLTVYDIDGNKEVDIDELVSKRHILFEDLGKNTSILLVKSTLSFLGLNNNNNELLDKINKKEEEITLCKIVDSVKQLEEAVIKYRQLDYYGVVEERNREALKERMNNNNSVKENNPVNNQQKQIEEEYQQSIEIPIDK